MSLNLTHEWMHLGVPLSVSEFGRIYCLIEETFNSFMLLLQLQLQELTSV